MGIATGAPMRFFDIRIREAGRAHRRAALVPTTAAPPYYCGSAAGASKSPAALEAQRARSCSSGPVFALIRSAKE